MEKETKKSSLDWQFLKLREFIKGELEFEDSSHILMKAKEMHKKEMVMFVLNVMGNYKHGDVLFDVAKKLYTEIYEGGNK
jgi:hypothetical protein